MVELAVTPEDERTRMGIRGRQFFDEHFTRAAALPVYIGALKRAASSAGTA